MKTTLPKILLEEKDLNSIYNLLGHAWRSNGEEEKEYQQLISEARQNIGLIIDEAFVLGVEYAKTNKL